MSDTGPSASSLGLAEKLEWLARPGATALVASGIITVFAPLILTVYVSFFDDKVIVFPPQGYSLAWYGSSIPQFISPLLTSLKLALLAGGLSLLFGVPAGIALSRYRNRGTQGIGTLLLAPLTIPGIAIGLAIYVFAITVELRTELPLAGSMALLVLAHVLITIPWVIRICLASLTNHDRVTEEAAASLGASPPRVIWRVTLPAMRNGIVASGFFAFIISFENLEISLFLVSPGMSTLPIAILQYLEYRLDPLIAAISVLQIVGIGAILFALGNFANLGRVAR